MKRLLGEPLLQFLLLGVVLFAAQALLGGRLTATESAPYVVDQQLAGWLAGSEARTLQRAPTEEELLVAVQRHARLEALRREARRLGLDRGDPIVQRRLEQKMEFLLEGAPPPPTEEELAAWLTEHAERYAQEPIVALEHRFFGGLQAAEAQALTDRLAASPGDPFLGGPTARGTVAQLDARFGPGFGAAVFALEGDGWSAPITSSYGVHLVRVTERVPGAAATLSDVRERVRRDVAQAAADAERERRIDELVAAMDLQITADLAEAARAASP